MKIVFLALTGIALCSTATAVGVSCCEMREQAKALALIHLNPSSYLGFSSQFLATDSPLKNPPEPRENRGVKCACVQSLEKATDEI
jgi:hypothetical protein